MVLTCHGTDVRLAERHAAARIVARRVVRRAAVVTTVSRALAAEHRAPTSGARRPGRNPADAAGADATPGRVSGGGGLVAISRLTRQKRLALLIEAVALLGRQRPGDPAYDRR